MQSQSGISMGELVKKQQDINRAFRHHTEDGYRSNGFNPNNNPDWIFTPPQDISQTRYFNSRTWDFCTKCGRNGRWVVTHSGDSHKSSGSNYYLDRRSYHVQWQPVNNSDLAKYTNMDCKIVDADHGVNTHQHYRERYSSRSRSRSPYTSRSNSPTASHGRSISFWPPMPCSPRAQLSLLDSINSFLEGN